MRINKVICDRCKQDIPSGGRRYYLKITPGTTAILKQDEERLVDLCEKCHARVDSYLRNEFS